MLRRILLLAMIVAIAPGCSTIKGWFGSSTKSKVNQPTELTKIAAPISVKKLWSTSLGSGEQKLWLRQHAAIDGASLFAATSDGQVEAFDIATGTKLWAAIAVPVEASGSSWTFWKSRIVETGLTGSPGAGYGLVVVGGRNGEVVALNSATGEPRWSVKVSSEVLSAPLVLPNRVIVRSNDGRVFGLDPADGSRKWVYDRGLPTLSVRGNSSPVGAGGLVYIGYDDGKLVALRDEDGLLVWEQIIAEPDGRTELDRMADIDGNIVIDGNQLYVISYHDKVMALVAGTGQPLWTQNVGSAGGVAVASDKVVVSDKSGDVWALDRATGNSMWKQNLLEYRQLTTPVIQGDYAVVGDLDGYLHWLKLETGDVVGRAEVESAALRGTPQVSNTGVLYAISNEGKLAAYQLGN